MNGLLRWLYLSLGLACVGLAALGAVLPILPTTPFLILASRLFVRSDPRLKVWLLRMPAWGPMLRDWDTHRAVRPHAKWLAVLLIVSAVAFSVTVGRFSWPLLALLLGSAGIGLITVWNLPVILPATKSRYASAVGSEGPFDRIATDHCLGPN